jgi:branched-subunit amino acid aminotransferase/4-amino-4-deoxychorismate lyase
MTEPIAFLNGDFLPASALCVPVYDAGFVLGATVTEQLRTFAGRLFHLDEHLARLRRSLEIIGLESPVTWSSLADGAQGVVDENRKLIEQDDDLGLSIFATPGAYLPLADGRMHGPVVAMHSYPLPFGRWAELYDRGCALVTTPVQQIPAECWPAELKCRSRMHYYLADLTAQKRDSESRALLLNREGHVTETATANVLTYHEGSGLASPREETVLHGISLAFVRELAERLGIAFVERDLSLDDVASAHEVLLTSTPNAILPVTRLNGRAIASGRPGDVFRRLLRAWDEAVGVDIAGQAKRFASR